MTHSACQTRTVIYLPAFKCWDELNSSLELSAGVTTKSITNLTIKHNTHVINNRLLSVIRDMIMFQNIISDILRKTLTVKKITNICHNFWLHKLILNNAIHLNVYSTLTEIFVKSNLDTENRLVVLWICPNLLGFSGL